MSTFSKPIRPEDVAEFIDLTVAGDPETRSMADMQLEGIAALYNILCEHPFAYLADEVGMGKTYQALGLAALVWNEKPTARILFISPRQNLQAKWLDDYRSFFKSNYRRTQGLGDDRAASVLFNEPVHRPVLFHNLRSWTPTIGMSERTAVFVRHTSFMRPVYVTSESLGDLDDLWATTELNLRSWGLFDAERPVGMTPGDASRRLNLTFAQALNAKLTREAEGDPYFDLVIVDEAQCLRNPANQTNQVLLESLDNHVAKWLFMSATPAHGGPADLPTIINHYPGCGEVIPPELAHDLPALQEKLQTFLVRRQRRYNTHPKPKTVSKDIYRNHDSETWGVRDQDMTALATLAMGLVQKGLVDVLQGRSNRYRIGFLSSFESLQTSLEHTLPTAAPDSDTEDEQALSDWHRDQTDGVTDSDAPDAQFIQRLAADFEQRFEMPLPHPKVDAVVDRVAPLAFGTDTEDGGHKFLIFTRRVSTVQTLRDRLMLRYHQSIEARISRYWGKRLDWSGAGARLEDPDEADDPESDTTDPEESPFRRATAKGGWLFRYRQTFRATGRNALFFEDGWLQRLCVAGGVNPEIAAGRVPPELWAESWAHASRSSGARRQQHRARRMRYLAVQAISRAPHIFGLDRESAAPWRAAYEAALHEHLSRAERETDNEAHEDRGLFTEPTLWTEWDARFPDGPLALPAADPARSRDDMSGDELRDALCRRQVARTLLGQTFRLTDTLLDLYYADEDTHADSDGDRRRTALPPRFLEWLSAEDPGSRQVRRDVTHWLAHLRLIVDSCLESAGREWRELARYETWPQLYNPSAVLGVTGGSGAHLMATRQFRTPSLPRVIVCTDTLKEGVDLHLFCDRVLHYGVAWTSGDLEQRVGRVDRYFSQIERRLLAEGAPPAAQLLVGYPHVVASLERRQVDNVIARQKQAEKLMDSPLAGARDESKEIQDGASAPREQKRILEPYRPQTFDNPRRRVVEVSEETARASADHYASWYGRLTGALTSADWRISPDDPTPVREWTLHGTRGEHGLRWTFDAALGRYLITVSGLAPHADASFSGAMRRSLVGRRRVVESFLRLLVPAPDEGADDTAIARFVAALGGHTPIPDADARAHWAAPLAALAKTDVRWVSPNQAQARIPRGIRAQEITLYAYDNGVRIVSVIAPIHQLSHRDTWNGAPTPESVRDWALDRTNDLDVGYLAVHPEDGLVFANHLLHGDLSPTARRRLIEEVAWRADSWEAALTGADRR